ncbi:sulfonate transport system ATP-binding protein [Ruminiclostridium sufflavum DSM 19573]|uniref:Sulfonate transport system ATP-binding protein n=1 Tax=Ruminiclostridium sufflavum DSM 19573 TaxID=1121337 RepID=A0A318XQ23_9FIRM|nr:ABC transporter ATP-binding protein [Ruminiclostridium sufflavum]PYG89430.1 sulfonate transport system ATP-binding protein [Ruminiclostridium sufflavum DSM 19573]
MSEKEYKVEVKNLCKSFGTLEVLKDCSFNIKRGEFVCVVGPTGCGKTTFLNTLTCLTEPTSGEILVDGEPANPEKHNLSFVFQEPSAVPWLTVEQNIRFGLEIKKKPKEYIDERVENIISMMALSKYRDRYPHELSTSAEQKIVIGRAFAMNPDLLLMDEPYGQMDIKTRFYLEDEVVRLWETLGCTIVFITHNVEEAVYLAERVLILSQKPASIKESIAIDLPRPRDIASKKFIEYRTHIVDMIKWW